MTFAVANKTVDRQVTWRAGSDEASIPTNLRTFLITEMTLLSQSELIYRLSQNLTTENTKTNLVMK